MRKVERMLDAPAVVHDASDFGTISRSRVWWCRVPWQEIAHRKDCPYNLRWTTMQGIPRVHFDVDKDTLDSFDTEGLSLPRCLTEEAQASAVPDQHLPTTRKDAQHRGAQKARSARRQHNAGSLTRGATLRGITSLVL